ncbi:Hypothetical Protein NTJ_00182 [Nesidiocoris tenuis]|uniref:RNA-directed DNA polymerase n=1 Tax=Nesidiocoris tenuis TaxID=355587 RepID=A0ABN7A800_9HEMI|nr:Hypothetical Protein NTJ_00182 [Nesidiocoris tenuis]
MGKIKGVKARIHVKPNSVPVFKQHRNVPFSLVPKIEAELDRLEKEGIISKIEHSDYATPVVPVIKGDGTAVRLCGDDKVTLNPQLLPEDYPIPGIESILANIGNAKFYSKLDICQAFNHIEIHEDDRHYLTLNTIKGLFTYNRLPFGITNAPHIWQRTIEKILGKIKGVQVLYDDICVSSESEGEHIKLLDKVFMLLHKNNIRINLKKCSFLKPSIKYCGYIIGSDGLRKCPKKVEAILKIKQPTSVTEVKSFLGAVNFYGRFVPELSTLAHPLYQLLRKDANFNFDEKCRNSFNLIKQAMASERVLTHFDPKKLLVLSTDASPFGFGAVLSHRLKNGEERPIAFGSRTLNSAEVKYSQIEKEAAAIIYGVKKFFSYLYGNKFKLITDHKPLITIFGPQKGLPPLSALRLQRYAIFLQGFNFEIEYRRSSEHGNADCLSRFPVDKEEDEYFDFDINVFSLSQIAKLPVTSREISRELATDFEAKPLLDALKGGTTLPGGNFSGHPQHEFSMNHDCLFWNQRVYIPQNLRKRILKELHEGHQGMVKCKALARSFVWWPKISDDIDTMVSNCWSCVKSENNPAKFPFHRWQTPASPMERIHVDYAGPFKNHYFLIIVDAYSRWVDVHPVRNMTSATTIELLKRFFTDFGLPHVIVSDNGTQFKSSEFRNFCESLGIIQKLTAPYHPATNGLAERGVQSLKASIRSSVNEGSNVQDAVLKFLTSYRRSPHSVTGKSPASLFLGRAFRSKIDLVRPQHSSVSLTKEDVRRPREFSEGTKVAFRCYNDPAAKWKIGIVMARKGDLHYEIKCDNITFFRHVDQIRQAGEHLENSSGLPDLPFPAPITDIDQPQPDPIPMMPDQEEEQPRNLSEGPKSPEFTLSSPPRRTSMQAENSTITPKIQTSTRRGRIIRKPVKLDL